MTNLPTLPRFAPSASKPKTAETPSLAFDTESRQILMATTMGTPRNTMAALGVTLTLAAGTSMGGWAEAATRPPSIQESIKQTNRLGAILAAYVYEPTDYKKLAEHFQANQDLLYFLSALSSGAKEVYGPKIDAALQLHSDPDTGAPLLEVVILSDLPIDDEFEAKDRALFDWIERTDLTWGLGRVVLSQG